MEDLGVVDEQEGGERKEEVKNGRVVLIVGPVVAEGVGNKTG